MWGYTFKAFVTCTTETLFFSPVKLKYIGLSLLMKQGRCILVLSLVFYYFCEELNTVVQIYVTFTNMNLEVSKRHRKQNVESQMSFLGKYLVLFAIYLGTKFYVLQFFIG